MYNFTVDEAHTYFVGEGEWLVHNACIIRRANLPDLVAESRARFGISAGERNIGFANFYSRNSNGTPLFTEDVVAISGYHKPGENPYPGTVDLLPPEQRTFDYLTFEQTNPGTGRPNSSRAVDSEAKLLEYFAGILPQGSTGQLYLYTERRPCGSCQLAIQQFDGRYPEIDLIISYTYEY